MSDRTLLSMSEAAKMVGLTRPTFYRKVDELGISVNEDGGKKRVDVSELIRVFGNDFTMHKEESKTSKSSSLDKSLDTSENLDARIAVLEAELRMERELREEIKDEVTYFKEQIALEKEEKKKITLLLEDHRNKEGRGETWEKSIKALEQRLANQERSAKEREDREQRILKQNRGLKKALEQEKNKGFFQKLFG